jgi:hypothetical protein
MLLQSGPFTPRKYHSFGFSGISAGMIPQADLNSLIGTLSFRGGTSHLT